MDLDRDKCYEALRAKDARFDGVFFVAVKSTKIYCRPVCRAKLPKFENCTFYRIAAAAEAAGYRPCLRCRPELAPGNSATDSSNRLAAIALNRIEDGALTLGTLDQLADEMGITSRHLRRVVESEFGVSPVQLAQTHRLLLAKRLLTDTRLPITEIAFASGFSSVRRFNSLFLDRYSLAPSSLRKNPLKASQQEMLCCEISYRSPFDWQSTLNFLAARACPGVEVVVDGKYARTACFGKHRGWIEVEHNHDKNNLSVKVSMSLAPALSQCVARAKRLFDLQCNPAFVASHLGDICATNPGLRLPGAFDGFELAVRAILGQQVSVKAATTLAGRLAERFGDAIETPIDGLHRISPTTECLAKCTPEDLKGLSIMPPRIVSILTLAKMVHDKDLSLEPGADPDRVIAALKKLPGIGEWTAQYIAMRALSWPDAFPHSDLGIKKALNIQKESEILRLAEAWRPWRAYAAMHLWKSLEKV